MGKRGPQRTPTKLLKARGSWRADTPDRKNEVKTESGMPDIPEFLSLPARRRWLKLAPILMRRGLLTEMDGDALGRYCEAMVMYVEAKKYVDALIKVSPGEEYQSRLLVRTTNGNVIQNPAISLMKNAGKEADNLGKQFGLTPSARSGLTILPVAKPSTQKGKKKSPFKVA